MNNINVLVYREMKEYFFSHNLELKDISFCVPKKVKKITLFPTRTTKHFLNPKGLQFSFLCVNFENIFLNHKKTRTRSWKSRRIFKIETGK